MPLELLWLLLPVAAASGWWMASRRPRRDRPAGQLTRDYFRGMNFLINEQPDKAIEIFVRMVEVDSDTVEPHFALGNLFRRQGEVERAIRIHQNLIARPMLTREQRNQALFELARDFQQAGLLDRAESLFREILEHDKRNIAARRLLIDVYEQLKDWEKAIDVATEPHASRDCRVAVAHYYCELAELALQGDNPARARKLIRRAFSSDRHCVRASLLAGESARAQDRHRAAIRAFRRIEKQDPGFLCEALPSLFETYEHLGRQGEALQYAADLIVRQETFRSVATCADYLARHGRAGEAHELLMRHLRAHPSLPGVAYLLESPVSGGDLPEGLRTARDVIHRLLERTDAYHCENCAYCGNLLRWQCPSCRAWGSVRPWAGSSA